MEFTPAELDDICQDWIRLLTLVLRWPQDAAAMWARDHIHFAESDLFLHETTSYYILPLIVTDEVKQNSGGLGELQSKLELALERFRQKSEREVGPDQVAAIREEIRAIIDANRTPPGRSG